jgi:hypothetical protein
LRTLAIIFLTYLLLKYLGRILAPILLKRFVSKMQDRFQGQFNQQFNQQDSPVEKEGKVSIKTKPKKSKDDTNDMGEYVDFEEVDD